MSLSARRVAEHTKSRKTHGNKSALTRLAAAEPKADRQSHKNTDIRQTSPIDDPRSHEIERIDPCVGQSLGNPEIERPSMGNRDRRVAALQAAIDRLTHAIATADEQAIPSLVVERRAMREELAALLTASEPPG